MRSHAFSMILSASLLLSSSPLLAGPDLDSRLRNKIESKLDDASYKGIDVSVTKSVVTLSGVVSSVGLKERAAKNAMDVAGISGVSNNLRVDAGDLDDSKLVTEASRRIRRYPYYTIFDYLELSSVNGHLVVRGQVTQPWRRADVGRILEMVPGVRSLENEVEVLPLSGMDDSIRQQVAAAIYRNPVLSRYSVRANPPIHIIVKNGNVVLTGFVHTTLEKSVAERAARFAAIYFSLDNQLQVENSETTRTLATGAKQST